MLAVGRNVPATTRLLDALELLRGDRRVSVKFTMTNSSAFMHGADEVLDSSGGRIVPWEKAVDGPFDLAISASAAGPLHRLQAPLLLLPHGAGQHKRHLDGLSGIVPEQLLHNGRVVPSTLLLTGPEGMSLLARDCPQALTRAKVAGDLSLQQLQRALLRRDRLRRALGIEEGQRLVVVSSTWGPASVLGKRLSLVDRVLADLPADEYRVAVVHHPNIRARHGDRDVRSFLADALDAGLMLIPPESGWQAALAAADCVIGDHGSVTFYAAALGIPVLLAATGEGQVPPDGPIAALVNATKVLGPRASPRALIEEAINEYRPDLLREITSRSLAHTLDAAQIYRDEMYRLMDLPAPRRPPRPPSLRPTFPAPKSVTSYIAYAVRETAGTVRLERFPAAVGGSSSDADRPGRMLVADIEEEDPRFLESADVLVDRDPVGDPGRAATGLRRRSPIGLLGAASAGPRRFVLDTPAGIRTAETSLDVDVVVVASAAYAYLRKREPLPRRTRVLLGERELILAVR